MSSWSTAHGGSSTSLLDIVRSLDRRRFDPLVVCPEPGPLPDRLAEAGVPVVVHPLSRCTRDEAWSFLREVPWYLRLLRRRGVALVHGNTSASRRSVLQAAMLARLPYVQHVRNGADRPGTWPGCRYASRIIVNSHAAAAPFYADAALASKTVTIHNGIDLTAYDTEEDRRPELGAGSRPIVGFVGQVVPRKGVATLLKAMPRVLERHPDAWLVIVGCPPPDDTGYDAECRRLASSLGIAASVKFVGYRRDVPAWMRTFDVFALPTRSEPFGKVIVEAMAARCPVIASRVGGIPEIIDSAELGVLIEPDDEMQLASAILRVLGQPSRTRAMADAARRHARAAFGLTAMMERLQNLYSAVLRDHRSSRAA